MKLYSPLIKCLMIKFQVLLKTRFLIPLILATSSFSFCIYVTRLETLLIDPIVSKHNRSTKIILWYIAPRYINRTSGFQKLPACENSGCYTTTGRQYLKYSDVVIFNAELITSRAPPPRTSPDQLWVFQNMEANRQTWLDRVQFRNEQWRSAFNLTMWYRRDADLYTPYGRIWKKKHVDDNKNWTAVVAKKVNRVAWMMSNYNAVSSRRYEYVKLLQKYVEVDVYGESDINTYPRSKTDEFVKMVGEKYKFYLSFENSFCEDYISEKAFLYFKDVDVVPVVRGAGTYSDVLPKDTYIDTADFTRIEALGKHLRHLMDNDAEYISVLKRKHQYTCDFNKYIIAFEGRVTFVDHIWQEEAMCDLCHRAHNIEKYRKSIENIGDWFDRKKCWDPSDLV